MIKYVTIVVALLVERSLPTPEVRSSNPVIGKLYITVNCFEKTKIKKLAGNGQLLKQWVL